jgi:hypothetical protein
MKTISFFTTLFLTSVCYSAEDTGKICMHIPERGAETVIVEHNCKKGDIIQINKLHVPRLCDFNTAVVNLEGRDQFVCVYLGEQRAIREGTN